MQPARYAERRCYRFIPGCLVLAVCIGCGGRDHSKTEDFVLSNDSPAVARKSKSSKDEWLCFGRDAGRSGWSSADIASLAETPSWTFDPGESRWDYRKGVSVWSSPVIGSVGSETRVYIGSYDHHLYCLDATSGKKLWAFTAGDGVLATPAMVDVGDQRVVVFGSADRTVYALSADSGERIWVYETFPWSQTVSPCRMGAPVGCTIEGRPAVLIAASNNDRNGRKNIQSGVLYLLDARTGQPLWKKELTTTFVTAPCVGRMNDSDAVFVACQDGTVYALSLVSGEVLWKFTANELIHSSTSFAVVHGKPLVFFGTRHNSVYALDATTGRRVWKFKCGYWVDSTPAVASVNGRAMVYVGSYDRGIYALDARTGEEVWKKPTGEWISASPIVASQDGRPTIFVSGLDGHLRAHDAADGSIRWSFDGGKFLWTHIQQGDAVWSSPAIAEADSRAIMVYPSFSYRVHGFVR